MWMKREFLLLAVIHAFAIFPAWAHHAYSAEYDENKPIRLEGTIALMEWVNPHAVIHVDVRNSDGSISRWAIQSNSPNTLLRRGITKKSVEPGMKVVIEGYQARNGSTSAVGAVMTFGDGRAIFLGSRIEWPWPPKARNGVPNPDNQ